MKINNSSIDLLPQQNQNQSQFIPSYLEGDFQCQLCAYQYDLAERLPMMLCNSQHNCCLMCARQIIIKKKQCPFCRSSINIENIHKNRMLCKILEEVAKKKGVQIKINDKPEKQFIEQRKSLAQVQEPNIPPDINAALFQLNEALLNQYRQIQQEFQPESMTCFQKIWFRIQFKEPLYFFAYFLIMIYNFPFFIVEINYALNFQQQLCLDKDFGVGMSLRTWMLSSSIIGLSMYGIQWLLVLWKICLPRRKKFSQAMTVANILGFILKFLGYNSLGFVVYYNIDEEGKSDCSGSILAYMEALFIIQIVIFCGLCSLFKGRR